MDPRIKGEFLNLRFPSISTDSWRLGPRANVSHSNAAGHLSEPQHSLHLYIRRREHLWSGSGPRSFTSLESQNYVPAYFQLGGQHSTTLLRHEAAE